jgi:biopolymer transport protein ExbD
VNLRPRRRAQADINLTPLIDVVFLLLIFFMVSTTFKDEARLRVQLPEAGGEEIPSEEPEMIRILIDQSGSFYVDDQAVADRETGTLVQALEGALGDRADLARVDPGRCPDAASGGHARTRCVEPGRSGADRLRRDPSRGIRRGSSAEPAGEVSE